MYYYYTYDITDHFNSDKTATNLESAFAMRYDVEFKDESTTTNTDW